MSRNQCDGCRQKLPVRKGSGEKVLIHYNFATKLPVQVCTKDRYKENKP